MKDRIKDALAGRGLRLERISEEERRLSRGFDPLHAPTAEAAARFEATLPRLQRLESEYAADLSPMSARGLWTASAVAQDVRLQFFRGDNLYLWQYTRSPMLNKYRTFIYANYIQHIDHLAVLPLLDEDGAFGCFTYEFAGRPTVSRDVLDSVAEINFLARHVELLTRPGLQVLDIGAGYGRLAHRMLQAAPQLGHYWCVDAIPQSTYLCDYYLDFRQVSERSTVIELPDVTAGFCPQGISLAVNVHSFSEMPQQAIAGWLAWLRNLRVEHLLIIPNERTQVLSREADGSRRDCAALLNNHGFKLEVSEPVIDDMAVRDLLNVHDHFLLYRAE